MRERGIVEVFGPRGFGFIRPLNGGRNVFCHQSDLLMGGFRQLHAGDIVEYDMALGSDGRPRAAHVKLIQPAEPPRAPGVD